jgi:hypothetical protein
MTVAMMQAIRDEGFGSHGIGFNLKWRLKESA